MDLEKAILAVITTNESKIAGGAPIFLCEDEKEAEYVSANLEAILDGIAHALSDELYIIVKH
ncbi:capping complex subunit for YIEGIA [Virgibacillus kimchii]